MMMQTMFSHMLETSIIMSVLIVIVWLCSPLLERKYSPRLLYVVWLAITIRLLLPFPVTLSEAPIHIQAGALQESNVWKAPLVQDVFPITNVHSQAQVHSNEQAVFWSKTFILKVLQNIWIAGTLLFVLYHLLSYFQFIRHANRWSIDATPEQNALFETVQRELRIKKNVTLRKSIFITSPMLYGIVKPTVVLPAIDYPSSDLHLIFKHELTHLKRHDLVIKIVVFVVQALYWFNPFVHLLAKKFNETMELICDEHVVNGQDQQYKIRYMETILQSVEQQSQRSASFTSNYNGGIKTVKKRFKNISWNGTKKKGFVALGAFIVIFAASSSLIAFGPQGNETKKVEAAQPTKNETGDTENTSAQDTDAIVEKAPITGVYAETSRHAALERLIIDYFDIPEEDLGTTKYYYNYVDVDADGAEEIFTVVMGPYSSGSGGSTALLVKENGSGEVHLQQALTLIQTPVIISDQITNGYKEIVVMYSGGGASGSYVALTANNGKYTPVNDGRTLEGLEGITGQAIISNEIAKDMEEGKAMYLSPGE